MCTNQRRLWQQQGLGVYARFCDSHLVGRRSGSCSSLLSVVVETHPSSCRLSFFGFRFKILNDENSSHLLYFNCALRWFALRMDILMNIVTFVVALLVTLSFSSISASSKGLSLSYIIQVTAGAWLSLAYSVSEGIFF